VSATGDTVTFADHELRELCKLGRAQLLKLHRAAEMKSARWSAMRASLPPGASRHRVTSANARWARAAEARDRYAAALRLIDDSVPR
jgi:hypothetical protein